VTAVLKPKADLERTCPGLVLLTLSGHEARLIQYNSYLPELASGLQLVQSSVDLIKPKTAANERSEETSFAGDQESPELVEGAVGRAKDLELPDEQAT
jgi:hypothetical protein